jgi:hypothetical protein
MPGHVRSRRRVFLALAVLVLVAGAGGLWLFGPAGWESYEGYFGPAFSTDGRVVYAIVRRTTGPTWARAVPLFSAPSGAFPVLDRVSLVEIDVNDGRASVLESWPSTPVARRIVRADSDRVFDTLQASVKADASGTVRYDVEMTLPAAPNAETHRISGTWSPRSEERRRGEWQPVAWPSVGSSEPILAGDAEVFAVPGPKSFPSGVVLLDHRTMTVRPIARARAYAKQYPNGPSVDELLRVSRKAEIERLATIAHKRADLVAQHRAEGMSEIDAILKSLRELEDLGYLPKSPRIVAHRVAGDTADMGSMPLFDIAEGEMASGIFQDLEKALSAPETEVEKSMGAYVIHRDYGNSQRLNAYLAGGGRQFVVRFRGVLYRVEMRYFDGR